ncbi:uncharacterized protein FFB20_15822 [Fusarium fujikuroi]|nr:uncharacterized protein FFE2_00920 [Fusarium fujikuroi]SCN70464.1 uncharacterized protein FFC1_00915 [Fusarium fujikuroi]SCO19972.1 uncharacterized protein FFB20_15822 [Fusarium fujikuroi]SCO29425.1 uncharacterized protein FFNC_00918 [Fusarium fujikuroi]SCV27680.1 uncharacterized protein FFFS_00919 [Fusarium fujikuroi]
MDPSTAEPSNPTQLTPSPEYSTAQHAKGEQQAQEQKRGCKPTDVQNGTLALDQLSSAQPSSTSTGLPFAPARRSGLPLRLDCKWVRGKAMVIRPS